MNLIIRPLWEAERKYTYSQSSQITAQTGLIGHLRGALETVGSSFLTSWDDHSPQLNTADFKTVLMKPSSPAKIVCFSSEEQTIFL